MQYLFQTSHVDKSSTHCDQLSVTLTLKVPSFKVKSVIDI